MSSFEASKYSIFGYLGFKGAVQWRRLGDGYPSVRDKLDFGKGFRLLNANFWAGPRLPSPAAGDAHGRRRTHGRQGEMYVKWRETRQDLSPTYIPAPEVKFLYVLDLGAHYSSG